MRPDERRLLIPLVLLAAVLTVATGAWGHLYNETDGQYGGAAKVMTEGGSWLIPDNNGVPRLVKPPLLYWGMAGSMKVFGVTEFAARLPGAISICAWVLVTFFLGSRLGNAWRGFLAGAILLTSLGTFTLGRIVMPEPTFCALIAGSLLCVVLGIQNTAQRRWWYLGFWICASLASFTKGWHGLLYPLAIVGLAALFRKDDRPSLKGLFSLSGLVIFLLTNLPWYAYVEWKFPGYFHNLFFAEQLGHMAGSDSPSTSYTSVPRWQFLVLHLAWFFPWSLAALALIGRWTKYGPMGWERTLLLSWIGVVLGSVLLTGERQDYYAMAMWPAVALWMASVFASGIPRWTIAPVIVILGLALAATLAIPLLTSQGSSGTVAERATAWTTVTNFDPSVWASLRLTALLALGTTLATLIGALFLATRKREVALILGASCLCLGALSGTAVVAPYFTSAAVADIIERETIPVSSKLIYDGGIDTGSSLLFYTDRPVVLLDQSPEEDFIVRKFGIGRDRFTTTGELAEWWTGGRVVLVTEERKLGQWQQLLGQPNLAPVGKTGTQIVLSNGR